MRAVCVCVCVTYISDICQIHWHICWCEWHWACRPSPSAPSPLYSPWHGTVLRLLYGVMRQTDETDGGSEAQSGVKLTGVLNYTTWSDNTSNTAGHFFFNANKTDFFSLTLYFLYHSNDHCLSFSFWIFSLCFLPSFPSVSPSHICPTPPPFFCFLYYTLRYLKWALIYLFIF